MTTPIAIRITADNDDALRAFTEPYRSIWCKEEPDLEKHCNRTHYHGLVYSSLSNNGLRKQIYNHFDVSKENQGNKTLAFSKITDLEGYLRYICKGTQKTYPNIVSNSFLGDEWGVHHSWLLDKDPSDGEPPDRFFPSQIYYYDKYWATHQELQDKLKNHKAEKRTAKQNFKDYFINDILPTYNQQGRPKLNEDWICILMYHWYKKHDKELPSKSQGQIICNDLYLRYTAPDANVELKVLQYYGFAYL